MNRLLILSRQASHYQQLLTNARLQDLEIEACPDPEQIEYLLPTCNIVLGSPYLLVSHLDEAVNLEWLQSTFAGVDVMMKQSTKRDFVITGVKGIFGQLISEYVFAYILALERNLFPSYGNQKNCAWTHMRYESVEGKLLGILGLGSIGSYLARVAKCFGLDVWGIRKQDLPVQDVDRVFTSQNLYSFLSKPDYIVNTLPLTQETKGLFNLTAFETMKPAAVFINVGRGQSVVECDLTIALKRREIRAAVLDVFEEEPLPSESELWSLPNTYITPHNAAVTDFEKLVQIFIENYHLFREGKPLNHVIDWDKGY